MRGAAMTINLGLVELGGDEIDIPNIHINGYVYKFADPDSVSGDLRVWYNIKKLTYFYHHKHPKINIFVNYDSPECLTVAVKWFTMFRNEYESVSFLFKSGNVIVI